jgi:hypothetical protein
MHATVQQVQELFRADKDIVSIVASVGQGAVRDAVLQKVSVCEREREREREGGERR